MSWSAIAQIESGRRRDVRLTSLTALADALTVTVDHLIGRESPAHHGPFSHQALLYGSDDELLAGAVPFLAEGVERSERVLVVASPRRIRPIREALADQAAAVEFIDSPTWYGSPAVALRGYRKLISDSIGAGFPWVRVVGEAVWSGHAKSSAATWIRYESMVNLYLASLPATIVCLYDTRSASDALVLDAQRTHPELCAASGAVASPSYREPEDFMFDMVE